MDRRVGICLGIAVATISALAGPSAFAQEDPSPMPAIIEAEKCAVTPRTQEELAALIATSSTSEIDEAFSIIESVISLDRTSFTVPDGESVDASTAETVSGIALELYSCLAIDNFGAVAALTTDSWLVGMSEISFVSAATPPAAIPTVTSPIEQPALTPIPDVSSGAALSVCDVRELESGHVGLVAEITPPEADTPNRRDYLLFREVDGRWLLDAIVTGIPGAPTCS